MGIPKNWEKQGTEDGSTIVRAYNPVSDNYWYIASLPGGILDQDEAIVNLICAAPDLLAACEDLLRLFESFSLGEDWIQPNYLAVKEAKAAIAKARGRDQ